MIEKNSSSAVISDRLSFLWLFIAAVLMLFSAGKWIIPLAVWLGAIFLLRFIRTQKPLRGYILALIANSIVSYFALQGMMPMPPVGFLIIIIISSLIGLLPYLADRLLASKFKNCFVSTIVFPLAVTALEYLSSLTNPFGSWGATAYSQAGNLPLIQIVSITGIWGISFLIFWLASVINWLWERKFVWKKIRIITAIYSGTLSLILLLGGARLNLFPPASNTVRVAGIASSLFDDLWKELKPFFVEGGKAAGLDWDSILAKADGVNDDLFELSEQAARAGAKIVFWAEAHALLLKENEDSLINRGRELARQQQIYLGMTVGAILHRDADKLAEKKMLENKIIFIDPSGEVAWTYFKSIPVPGGEEAITVKGEGKVPTLDTPYGRIAAAICFDMDFPPLPRLAGKDGADLIFVPSGDWKEIDPYHTHMAFFRAVENGFSLIRIVNNGFSAAVDYQGRVLGSMDHFKTRDRVMLVHVPIKGVATIYSQIGDVFAWLCIAGFLLVFVAAIVRRKDV